MFDRTTELWANTLEQRLTQEGKPPDNFIPGCFPDSTAVGPIINKYRAMLEVQNTPFPSYGSGLGPIKRLWRFLIHQEAVQCMFIRYIFGKSRPADSSLRGGETLDEGSRRGGEVESSMQLCNQLININSSFSSSSPLSSSLSSSSWLR